MDQRDILDKPVDSAYIIPIVRDKDGNERILFLHRSDPRHPEWTIDLPGGGVNNCEGTEHPEKTARREFEEETGIKVETALEEVGLFETRRGTYIAYYAHFINHVPDISISHEHVGYSLLTFDEFNEAHHRDKAVVTVHGDIIGSYLSRRTGEKYEGREGDFRNGHYYKDIPLYRYERAKPLNTGEVKA